MTAKRYVPGLCVLGFVFLVILFGSLFSTHAAKRQNLSATLAPPSSSYFLGTDHLGRSILSRMSSGGKYSIIIAALSVTAAFTTGTCLGLAAGYFNGWTDILIMRLVDAALAFPGTLLAIILAGILGGSLPTLIIALSATMWCDYCRIARNITRSIKNSPHVEAGRIIGFSSQFIIQRYILPDVMPQLLTLASLGMGRTILNIAGLGFLGIGLTPPLPEWGNMINQGISYLEQAPWIVIAPGVMIFSTVLGFHLLAGTMDMKRTIQ